MSIQPTGIELHPEQGDLEIAWSDNQTTHHSMQELRRQCPCASCRAERKKMSRPGPMLRIIEGPVPQDRRAVILECTPVGRYALSFRWNDGHQTGIYSYDFLREHALDAG